ncbi:hypothetical protein PPACK8108_LOCUS6832 [Phakopsora pachyrhizi]|uniref:Uncharacterized protein n=1 Tax=Phakopsora pachyrhizi TaxID=170000 RepID=A0AAV0ATE1_PHAPC|nr:hypothetical protein PPACK8108_LOCUS6832 [Phakopsora pachyrhizi]
MESERDWMENSSNNLNSGSYERFCKNVLDPISVSNPFKVQIDAIAEEVQKKNQVASKIALAVMSKLDGKPDDVHDEEYHTMIEGMLSNKEFRKTLPAGLVEQYYDLTCGYSRPDQFGPATSSFSESDNLNLFNGNLITILINATKKATNATAAILGNHNKTTNPGTFLSASTVAMAPHPDSSPGLPSHSNLRMVQWGMCPYELIQTVTLRNRGGEQNGEIVFSDLRAVLNKVHEEENGGKKDLNSKIVKVLPVHEVMCPFTAVFH